MKAVGSLSLNEPIASPEATWTCQGWVLQLEGARKAMRSRWGWGVRVPPEWVIDDRFASENFVRVWRDAPVAQLFVAWEKGNKKREPKGWLIRRNELVRRFYEEDEVVFEGRHCGPEPTSGSFARCPAGGAVALKAQRRQRFSPLVSIDRTDSSVVGQTYRLGFSRNNPAMMDRLALSAAPDAPDILDRSKIRTRMQLPLGITVERHEDDVRTEGIRWKTGPLRERQ